MHPDSLSITWQYTLSPLLRAMLGAEYIHIFSQHEGIHFGSDISAIIWSPIVLQPQYYYFEQREKVSLKLSASYKDTFAGDLYGITVEQVDSIEDMRNLLPLHSQIAVYGPVRKIVAIGEERDEQVDTADNKEDFR